MRGQVMYLHFQKKDKLRKGGLFFSDRLRKDTVSEKGGGFMKGEGLERFVKAQEQSYGQALQEIQNGRKRSHWMWYIFPQIQGLGHSPTAQYYAVRDQAEAKAYMAHPVLGSRLLEISKELLRLKSSNAREVFGSPDDMKLKSSMTLFETVSDDRYSAGCWINFLPERGICLLWIF
jgi:Uncharacterized conserved protein